MCYVLGNANSKDTRIGLENVNFGILEIKKLAKKFQNHQSSKQWLVARWFDGKVTRY